MTVVKEDPISAALRMADRIATTGQRVRDTGWHEVPARAPVVTTVRPGHSLSAETARAIGAGNLLLAVEAAVFAQSFHGWIPHLAAIPWDALGRGFMIPAVAVAFFVVKKLSLRDGLRDLLLFRTSFRGTVHGTMAVAAILVSLLMLGRSPTGAGLALSALCLAFAVTIAATFDWASAWLLRRIDVEIFEPVVRRVAVLGHGDACRSVIRGFDTGHKDLRVVAVSDFSADDTNGSPADCIDAIVALAGSGRLDELVLAPGNLNDSLLVRAIERLSAYSVDITLSVGGIGVAAAHLLHAAPPGRAPLVPLIRHSMRGWRAHAKRVFDVAGSALAIVVLLPLLAVIALAIKLESAGPVLFRQTRTGLNQKPFEIWKFRTMRCASEPDEFRQATRGDARITWVGRLLRPLSLDELPQLVNVLRGEMSLVGPRPHPLPLNAQFTHQVPLYSARHRVLPGMTGLAQIYGYRGETDALEKMAARISYDLLYIRNWSLLLDLRIVLLTACGAFTHRNAC